MSYNIENNMVGIGTDLHRLEPLHRLIIGGIEIESEIGCVAHSDGDVLLHALTDAILGAAGLGDIGDLFPDTDSQFKNADSRLFVEKALNLIVNENLKLINIDAVIHLQRPKLSFYKELIKNNIASITDLNPDRVNIKAKTGEKLGYIGNSLGVEAICVVQLESSL
jgi:2-C-methyl-D-erythritol 2,4-cyclodiphosphate synthase